MVFLGLPALLVLRYRTHEYLSIISTIVSLTLDFGLVQDARDEPAETGGPRASCPHSGHPPEPGSAGLKSRLDPATQSLGSYAKVANREEKHQYSRGKGHSRVGKQVPPFLDPTPKMSRG
eukprot:1362624-Amorphochlora_amoeboformis.AAC.1